MVNAPSLRPKVSRYPNGRDEKAPVGEGKEASGSSRDAAFRLCLLAGPFRRPPRHARPRGSKIHPIFLAFRRPPRRAHPRGAMIIPSCWGYLRIARSHPTMLLGLCIFPLVSLANQKRKSLFLSLSRRWISLCIFQLVMNVASYYHNITVDQRKGM